MSIHSDLGLRGISLITQVASTVELQRAILLLRQSVEQNPGAGGPFFRVKRAHFDMLRMLLGEKSTRNAIRSLGSKKSMENERDQ